MEPLLIKLTNSNYSNDLCILIYTTNKLYTAIPPLKFKIAPAMI